MVLSPLSPTVAQAFRETFGVSQCPPFFETDSPIVPVAIISQPSITIESAFQTPASDQTIVTKCSQTIGGVTCTTGTGLLLHTVTEGKSFYLTGLKIGGRTIDYSYFIYDNTTLTGTPILTGYQILTADTVTPQFNYSTPVKFVAGVFVNVSATQTNTFQWELSGFEV